MSTTNSDRPARDWSRLLREGLADGVTPENMATYIADNTSDRRTEGGFPPGYHEMIQQWVDSKTVGMFRKSGSFVRVISCDRKTGLLEVERLDTGKRMQIGVTALDLDRDSWDADTLKNLNRLLAKTKTPAQKMHELVRFILDHDNHISGNDVWDEVVRRAFETVEKV